MVDEWLQTTIHRWKPFAHRGFRRFDEWLTTFCKIFPRKSFDEMTIICIIASVSRTI
jgi:hypothetical protein